MNCMAMTNRLNNIDLSAITYDTKVFLYDSYFSSKSNTEQSFANKIEVLTLLCFLTQVLTKAKSENFKNSLDVLKKYIFADEPIGLDSSVDYIEGLSIICDDFLYGVGPIEKPKAYKTTLEIRQRIKELIQNWLPF